MPEQQVIAYFATEALPAAIQILFNQAEHISPEFSIDWFHNLHDTVYPGERGCMIYTVTHDYAPVLAMPIRVVSTSGGQQVEGLANFYTSLYAPVCNEHAQAADMATLLREVSRRHGPVQRMYFAPMDPDAYGFTLLKQGLEKAGWVPFRFYCFGNWYLPVEEGCWDIYRQSLQGQVRNTLERKSKRFIADGGRLKLIKFQGIELDQAIAAYESVYAASWKNPEPYPDFIPGLLRMCARRGWLRLGVAYHGETPIAAQIWIVCHGKAYIYKLAYDQAYSHYSPGTLLTGMLMQHVLDQDKVAEVDYLIGDDTYKQDWMPQRRERWGIVAYNPRNLRSSLGLLHEVIGRVGKLGLRWLGLLRRWVNDS